MKATTAEQDERTHLEIETTLNGSLLDRFNQTNEPRVLLESGIL